MMNNYNSNFERTYRVHNTDSWHASVEQNASLQESSNILLPESALNELIANNCDFPITLSISNYDDNTQTTHVGVQEFSSTDGIAILPNTILQRLSNPSTIRVKYIQLPIVQTIQLQPHHSSFLQHKNKLTYIRNTLAKLSCLSLDDTIYVSINNTSYKLNVTKLIPSIYNAVSMLNMQYSVGINLTKPIVNDMEDHTHGVSDIETDNDDDLVDNNDNNNNNDNNTLGNDNDNNDENAGFSDEEHGWSDDDDDDEYSDFEYDGQDKIPIQNKEFTPSEERKEREDNIELVPDSNCTDDGKSRKLKPITMRIDRRAWICEFCHAINNLLDSIQRNYKCIQCVGKYKPGQTIIESKYQDEPIKEKPTFTVWLCQCSGVNCMDWKICNLCNGEIPIEGLITFVTQEKPELVKVDQIFSDPAVPNADYSSVHANADNVSVPISWQCAICNHRWNCYSATFCDSCGADRAKKENSKIYRHKYGNRRDIENMGGIKTITRYPVISKRHEINQRLMNTFGTLYRNSLIVNQNGEIFAKNKWNLHNDVAHGMLNISAKHADDIMLELNPLDIAMNERNGYIAFIVGTFIAVLKPNGCNDFIVMAYRSITDKFNCKAVKWRIRFVGNDIYVFETKSRKILNYIFYEKKEIIAFKQEIYDPYFTEAEILDIVVTDELLIVLFDRWLGVYKLNPGILWYHAVSYAKFHNIRANSIEMSSYDDWEDMNTFVVNDEEEEKRGVEDKIFATKMNYKASIKNYCFINCEHGIIGVHPTNPTFDLLWVGHNVRNGQSFCNSRKFGTFWINNECDMICQSSQYDYTDTNVIFSLEKDFKWDKYRMISIENNDKKQVQIKDISKLNKIVYDEGYGISGRLLVNCTVLTGINFESTFFQLFNQNELCPLKQELERNDYFLMPGTNLKPFNLIVYVFEMLYGCDLLNLLIQSPDFNSVYALPGNDNENKMDIEQEKKEEIIDHKNKLLNIGSKCLIYDNNRWCDGYVNTILPIDEGIEYLKVGIVGGLGANARRIARYDKHLKYNHYEHEAKLESKKLKTKWKVGNKCLYFVDEGQWCPGEILEINDIYNNITAKEEKFLHVLCELGTFLVKCDENIHTLIKLDDVVKDEKEEKKENNINGDGIGKLNEKENDFNIDLELQQDVEGDNEGPLNVSYVAVKAIKAIGNVKAENDEDLVFVDDDIDMEIEIEIEAEGVNQIQQV